MEENTVEDNVIETQAGAVAGSTTDAAAPAAEKPVRKRASRRVTAPAGEAVAPVTVEAPAAAAVEAPAAAPAADVAAPAAEAAAEAPKKRVTRSRKKVVEAPAEQAEAPEAPAAEAAADIAADAEAPAEAPKKRATRSRKKAVEAPADDAAPAESAAGDAPAEAPAVDPAAAEQAAPAAEPAKRTRRARVTKATKATETEDAQATGDQAAPQNDVAQAADAQAPAQTENSAKSDAASTDDAKGDAAQADATQSDAERPARGRTRGRRGQKQDPAEATEAAQTESESDEAKTQTQNQNQKNQRGQKNGESQNGPDSNKQGDKNGETRSSRTRQRDRKRRGQGDDLEPEISEDDVLLPIAGILDVLDNYAFVRTSGYLPGTSDVYVSLGQVKKYGMKRGDAVVGAIRQPREGDQAGRQKYNAIVKVDSINGRTLEENETRVEFADLPAIYPERQLKLATGSGIGREIDAAAPIGFGQRGLLVVPKPARGVEVLSQLAAAVSANAPDAHLMLLLSNAQPEDITYLTRTVNGEVVAASFERPAEDQATVAELGIDRARRLAELGHDVVVLIDSVGDLARAYAQAQPVSARPAHGVIDEFAVTQVRRVLGAARNAENAGSLTVLATAASKTGVAADKQLLRELRPVANCEIRFVATAPAKVTVDAERSHTRGAAALQTTSAA